jgi:hypothetical protein
MLVYPVNCTQNTQPFGSGCGFWVSKGTYPKPIPKYSKNPIPIPKTHTQILKKSHTHSQNPYPNTQKIPYPHPNPSHTKYSFNLTVVYLTFPKKDIREKIEIYQKQNLTVDYNSNVILRALFPQK